MTGWDNLSPEEQDDAADAYLVAEKEQMPEQEEPNWDDEPPPWPVYEPGEQVPAGTRVMWSHGRGIGGTVVPLNELSSPFADADGPASRLAVLWDDGAEMLMDAVSLAPMTEDGPTPYPEPYPPFVPSDDPEAPF